MYHFTTNPPSRQVKPRPPIPASTRELHALVIRHLARTGQREGEFGRRAMNDSAFVGRLRRDDYRATPQTMRRVWAFISKEVVHA